MTAPEASSILVVDDDPVMRMLVEAALVHGGYRVRAVDSGHAALNAIEDERPDLVLSDVQMPGLSGFELVVRLRADEATATLPVLFLSGAVMGRDDVVYGLSLGADDYILKPVRMDELVRRVDRRLASGVRASDMLERPRGGLLSTHAFAGEVAKETLAAAAASGRPGVVGVVEIAERERLVEQFGSQVMVDILEDLAAMTMTAVSASGLVGRDRDQRLLILEPGSSVEESVTRATLLAEEAARRSFTTRGESLHITPALGLIEYSGDDVPATVLVNRARRAATVSHDTLDLRPTVWEPDLGEWAETLPPAPAGRSRTLLQFVMTLGLGLVLPFLLYLGASALGFDLAGPAYVVVVAALIITGVTIWAEGFLALRPTPMPEQVSRDYPPASAIIAAYLPNEAATIIDTLEAFLRVDYPGDLQVILAYNTPRSLPVEESLRALAAREARITVLRVEGSTSKAQNVNAALADVTGEFVGVFDADHHPARDAFVRAWHWLCDDYDVVQGHCVVRNGDVSWVARTVAVEFESIYSVSHPGRARLHAFGIFGGSNGYWRTDLLRGTRMRGSMLTEDIDSSLRVVSSGGRIASDPGLLSRELAPTTVRALWNQRMRWAQGWFQVSIKHLWSGIQSEHLSGRQKLGYSFLLGWREVYPWVSIQILPLVAFFAFESGGADRLDWFVPAFVLTTLFTLGVGPGQTLFAWLLGAKDVTRHGSWFWSYLLVSTLLYTEFKNTINRVSQMKEFTRERQWRVTPR